MKARRRKWSVRDSNRETRTRSVPRWITPQATRRTPAQAWRAVPRPGREIVRNRSPDQHRGIDGFNLHAGSGLPAPPRCREAASQRWVPRPSPGGRIRMHAPRMSIGRYSSPSLARIVACMSISVSTPKPSSASAARVAATASSNGRDRVRFGRLSRRHGSRSARSRVGSHRGARGCSSGVSVGRLRLRESGALR